MFRDFLTESEMSANCKDSPVEYVILLWCKENIWGSFQEKCCVCPNSYSESDGYVCIWIVELQTTFLEIVVFKSTLIIQMSLVLHLVNFHMLNVIVLQWSHVKLIFQYL